MHSFGASDPACISQLPAGHGPARLTVDGSPTSAGVHEPVAECGAPSAVTSTSPDRRLGRPRASPDWQARVMDQPPLRVTMFVGIDASKDRLDVPLRPSGESFAVPRDGDGLERLPAPLSPLGPAL